GIEVKSVRGASAQSTAEHAMAMLMALLRRLPESSDGMLDGRWCHRTIAEEGIRDLAEITVGIVGMGAVGRRIAALACAFGARVIYTRRVALDDLLRESDAVCLSSRTAKHEQPLLNAARIALLRDGAIVVSVGSSNDVDLDALRDAMQRRGVRAALDVFP